MTEHSKGGDGYFAHPLRVFPAQYARVSSLMPLMPLSLGA